MNRRSFFGAMVGAPAAVMAPALLTPVAAGPGGYVADVCGQPTSLSPEFVAHWRGLIQTHGVGQMPGGGVIPPLPPPWRGGY